ncbi:hypothetical protein ACFL1H_07640 [Nanoarchaeota archaeon]
MGKDKLTETFQSYIDDAKAELKRVDHLIYVSLKYTRTVDVIRHVVQRMINFFDYIIEGLLEEKKKTKEISSLPNAPGLRCTNVKDLYKDEKIVEMINFYLMLRKIMRAKFEKDQEYRRHVAMTALCEDGTIYKLDIDVVQEYYKSKLIGYQEYLESLIK